MILSLLIFKTLAICLKQPIVSVYKKNTGVLMSIEELNKTSWRALTTQ